MFGQAFGFTFFLPFLSLFSSFYLNHSNLGYGSTVQILKNNFHVIQVALGFTEK